MKRRGLFPPLVLLLLLCALLLLWELAAQRGLIDLRFWSCPSQIFRKLRALASSGQLFRHAGVTLQEAALGLLYGALFGTLSGILLGAARRATPYVLPLLVGLHSVPKLALAPLFILWFGIGLASKVLMASLMVYFLFTFNLYAGYRSISPPLAQDLRLLGASSWALVRHLVWPACLPWFLTSLRTGLGLALSGAVVGELIGASSGLGWLLQDATARYDIATVLALAFLLIAFMMLLDTALRAAERRLLKWRPEL